MTLGEFVAVLEAHACRRVGRSWTCPAHDDQHPSLSVSQGERGLLIYCHAGCDVSSVLDALGLDRSALFDDDELRPRTARKRLSTKRAPRPWSFPDDDVEAVHAYTDNVESAPKCKPRGGRSVGWGEAEVDAWLTRQIETSRAAGL